jgi:serine/threonine protein kinase
MERIDINVNEPVFAGWKIGKELGRGTFATVYELRKGNMVRALKVVTLLSDLDGTEDEIEAQLADKMEAASSEIEVNHRVSGHTNVVNYQEYEFVIVWNEQHTRKEGLLLYIMMERMEKTLQQEIREGTQFSEEQIIKMGKDIVTALKVCHEQRILHRDIKPANIFIADHDTYKLGDFGISKVLGDNTVAFTHTGTQAYVAPEQWNSLPYGKAADIYSVGLILYQLLNENHLPFSENGLNADSVGRRLKGETFPEPLGGSKRLKEIVMKACRYSASDRYQTADEIFSALETIHSDDTSEENADPYSTFSANMEFKPAKNTERAEGKKAAAKPDFDTDRFKSEGLTTLKDEYQTITFTGFMSKQEAAAEKKAVSLVGIGSMVICVLMICMAAVFLSLLQNETNCFYTAGTFILGLLRQMMDQINTLRGE